MDSGSNILSICNEITSQHHSDMMAVPQPSATTSPGQTHKRPREEYTPTEERTKQTPPTIGLNTMEPTDDVQIQHLGDEQDPGQEFDDPEDDNDHQLVLHVRAELERLPRKVKFNGREYALPGNSQDPGPGFDNPEDDNDDHQLVLHVHAALNWLPRKVYVNGREYNLTGAPLVDSNAWPTDP